MYNSYVSLHVILTRRAQRQIQKVPRHVVVKLQAWVEMVEREGLSQTRRIPGFHDEPLHGKLQGKRSIRLSRSYRAIYRLLINGGAELVTLEEVTKHDY